MYYKYVLLFTKVYVTKIEEGQKGGPVIILSRTHVGFVKRLLESDYREKDTIIKNLNHSAHDANLLVKRLHGIPSKVNLIGFNCFDGCKFLSPNDADIIEFQERLLKKGLSTSIRLARGDDELAACGQLGQKGRQS